MTFDQKIGTRVLFKLKDWKERTAILADGCCRGKIV
jgi:hypothetical protein